MNKVIFLGGLFPIETRHEIEEKSKGLVQNAADALQWAIVKGLDYYVPNLKLVNLLYIGSYPLGYKDFKIKTYNFSHNPNRIDLNVGFINLPLYRFYSRYYKTKKELKRIIHNNGEIIIVYMLHTPFIKAATDLKRINPSVRICLIVPDLPEFMGGSNNIFFKLLKRIDKKILHKLLKKVDAFVLLSEFMHEALGVRKRPWIRIEGIYDASKSINLFEKENHKTILYSGTLAKRYGILNLMDAFALIEDNNYHLWICGEGDTSKEIMQRARKDKRILFLGQIARDKVLKLQQRATILVNPRTSEGEFTKYSFPSKIMEYFASGTPCIMYPLSGIPAEYFNYCYIPEDETPIGLFKTITFVCEKSQSELDEFGWKAKQFIMENKTPEKQCLKIFNLLEKLKDERMFNSTE